MSSFGRGLAALGAVAGGYVKGLDSYERRLGDEEDRAMRKTQFENQQDVVNKQKKLDISLANAAAPREVQAGAVLDGGQTQEFYKDSAQVTPQMQADRPNSTSNSRNASVPIETVPANPSCSPLAP